MKILGVVMLVLPFIGAVVVGIRAAGWRTVLLTIGIGIILVIWFSVGAYLITGY